MADHLAFHDLQANTKSGAAIPEFTVKAHAVNHSTDTSYRTAITISISSGGGTLGGTLTKSCSSGVATFSDITLTGGEGTRILTASSGETTPPSGAELGTISIKNLTKHKSSAVRTHVMSAYGFRI